VFLIGYALMAARRALRPGALTPFDAPALPLRAALTLCAGFTFLNPHVYLDMVLVGVLANAWAAPANAWFGLGAALASLAWFAALGFGARLLRPVFAKPLAWRVLDGLIALTMGTLAMLLWFGPGPAVASL
jgi:L-lysine exporter family protein LysE/ArgO